MGHKKEGVHRIQPKPQPSQARLSCHFALLHVSAHPVPMPCPPTLPPSLSSITSYSLTRLGWSRARITSTYRAIGDERTTNQASWKQPHGQTGHGRQPEPGSHQAQPQTFVAAAHRCCACLQQHAGRCPQISIPQAEQAPARAHLSPQVVHGAGFRGRQPVPQPARPALRAPPQRAACPAAEAQAALVMAPQLSGQMAGAQQQC